MSQINQLIKDVVASPLGEIIASVGHGVAEAQAALDDASLEKTLAMYAEGGDAALQLLRDIGYQPTFYTLPETIGEVKIAMKLANTQQESTSAPQTSGLSNLLKTKKLLAANPVSRSQIAAQPLRTKIYATPVDATYANRYNYQADISAKLTFKIVPVPPPSGIEDLRILPNLVGNVLNDALERLNLLNLEPEFDQSISDADYNDYKVSLQTPAFNPNRAQIIRAGEGIKLEVVPL